MKENPKPRSHRQRPNVHVAMFTAELDIALVKLQAELEIGDKYALLYAVTEGLFQLGKLSEEDHDLHIKRYSRKLVDVVKEERTQRENSHVPVLTLEQQEQKQFLEQKDRQFKGQLKQWAEHPSPQWRGKALTDAEKYRDKLPSAREILRLGKEEQTCEVISHSEEEVKQC